MTVFLFPCILIFILLFIQASTPEHHLPRPNAPNSGRDTPPSTNNSTARSSRRDSLNDSNRTYAVPHQHHTQHKEAPQQQYHAVVHNSEKIYASPHQDKNQYHSSLDRMGGGARNESPIHNRTVTSSPVLGGQMKSMQSPTRVRV